MPNTLEAEVAAITSITSSWPFPLISPRPVPDIPPILTLKPDSQPRYRPQQGPYGSRGLTYIMLIDPTMPFDAHNAVLASRRGRMEDSIMGSRFEGTEAHTRSHALSLYTLFNTMPITYEEDGGPAGDTFLSTMTRINTQWLTHRPETHWVAEITQDAADARGAAGDRCRTWQDNKLRARDRLENKAQQWHPSLPRNRMLPDTRRVLRHVAHSVNAFIKAPDGPLKLKALGEAMQATYCLPARWLHRVQQCTSLQPYCYALNTSNYNGRHQDFPWRNEPWWGRDMVATQQPAPSEGNPQMLAYWQSCDKLLRGIRTPIKVGRYLTQFFGPGTAADLSNDTIKTWVNCWQARAVPGTLTFLNNDDKEWVGRQRELKEEWVRLYAEVAVDYSCMKGDESVRVYGVPGNHMGMAYLEASDGTLYCRSIVRFDTEPKQFVRTYPCENNSTLPRTAEHKMIQLLNAAGFVHGHLDGLRIHRIVDDSQDEEAYVMPYLDRNASVEIDTGAYWRITREGDYDCQTTGGYIYDADSTVCDCSCCGDRYDEDSMSSIYNSNDIVCSHCLENDDSYIYAYTRYDQIWCLADECIRCASDNKWYHQNHLSRHDIVCAEDDGEYYFIDDVAMTSRGYVYEAVPLDRPDNEGNEMAHEDDTKELCLADGTTIVVHEDYDEGLEELADEPDTDTLPLLWAA